MRFFIQNFSLEMASKWEQEPAVQRFREYLQIPSVHPDVNYDACVRFLKKEAASMDLPVKVVEVVPGKPVVILTWQGLQPELPSIMLNSHMDVVPVYEECWTHPPFAATITEDGWIWARGSQDMKVVGIQHMEAVRRLKESGVRLKRTVHLTYVPDEEIGSYEGMRVFVDTEEFKDLNLGFALDEAMPFPGVGSVITFTGERTTWQIKVNCPGVPGHGSLLASNTAGEKLNHILDKFMKARAVEKSKVDAGVWIGDVTTINLTKIEGGVQANVLPECLSAVFDLRLSTELNHEEFEEQMKTWCKEAGDDVTYEFTQKNPIVPVTRTDDSNPYWVAFRDTVEGMNIKIQNLICPGATDARFVRSKGIPAVGFTPLMQTPTLLHAHDERILVEEFLKGIDVMQKVVEAVGVC